MSMRRSVKQKPKLPDGPLKGATLVKVITLKDVSDVAALKAWLEEQGLDTSDWGSEKTKEVKKLWAEIEAEESGIELWRKKDGTLQPVRVTHVLRAKVCSPDSYNRNVFLFNTWQQFGDGRKRIRNALLSEKLVTSEMPLEMHLHEVCQRAVQEEEMQRLADPLLKIGPGNPAPAYDSSYACPLEVVDAFFSDHVIEVEASKSYPRLLTMYHLYTVDIVCTGLPPADFNTLEFDHPDANGNRPLKYVHAWVWMEWSQIQRYLFEGSAMKERKGMGDFENAADLQSWLEQFNLDFEEWGEGLCKDVECLYDELERQDSHLELWGRHDGVPLLMRVTHILQLKVCSTDPRLRGKFIYHTWTQRSDGSHKAVNRLMTKKLNMTHLPLDRARCSQLAELVVNQQLSFIMDPHYRLTPDKHPTPEQLDPFKTRLQKVTFLDHRVDVENSSSFKGLCTLYHLYTCEVEVEGLPLANFASLEVRKPGRKSDGFDRISMPKGDHLPQAYIANVFGWCWVVLPQCLDMASSRIGELETQLHGQKMVAQKQEQLLTRRKQDLEALVNDLMPILQDPKVPAHVKDRVQKTFDDAQQRQRDDRDAENDLVKAIEETHQSALVAIDRRLPPSMVSEMAEDAMVVEEIFGPSPTNMKTGESFEVLPRQSRTLCGESSCWPRIGQKNWG
jgi:hypothetical protein